MNPIKLLDQKTINKIAAGEVVEGPRSVVKELVENSIDAGATVVTVEIKEGGTSYIRITDNGCGILNNQVKTAFLPHATSKISAIEDLDETLTLGFRGEALASIAAVAQVEMTTRHETEDVGSSISIHAGEIKNGGISSQAATKGTTIIVKNLFYNVPARKKFLKKTATESGRISDIINRIALGHPHISFEYINNGTVILHTSGNNDPLSTVLQVYGKDAALKMLPIDYSENGFKLTGLIGKPELVRANRNYENLFINGRFIKNDVVSAAVEESYKTRIMIGKFPVFVLYFQLSPELVDANVHPAKLEVRFSNDNEIYKFFYNAVSKVFDGKVLIPKATWDSKKQQDKPINNDEPAKVSSTKSVSELLNGPAKLKGVQEPKVDYYSLESRQQTYDNLPKEAVVEAKPVMYENKAAEKTVKSDIKKPSPNESIKSLISQEEIEIPETIDRFFKNYKIVGQLFQTYWIVEQSKSMYVIDQHAAHERILFEDILSKLKNGNIVSQQLLNPVMLQLSEAEKALYNENIDFFDRFGFVIEQYPNNTYALKAVPYILKQPVTAAFLLEILDILAIDGAPEDLYDIKTNAIATIACKAAVKGHDKLSLQEAQSLIEQLLKLSNPFNCPHGRPTIIEMPIYELEKKFKRIQD